MKTKLKLGIPKGSLQSATIELFKRSGWKIIINGRSYFPEINDESIECAICRAQIAENNSDVHVVTDLVYSKVSSRPARWVVAVPYNSPIEKLEDLEGKKVATELVEFTKKYFSDKGIPIKVEFSWGATEAKAVSGLADAIVEVTETESTIKAHGLRIIHELMQTNTQLIVNRDAWKDKKIREKVEQVALLLKGALLGEKLVGLKMNVPEEKLETIVSLLPSLNAPTVSSLYQSKWFAVETVIDSGVVRELIPKLLKSGAEGIIEYPLNKVV